MPLCGIEWQQQGCSTTCPWPLTSSPMGTLGTIDRVASCRSYARCRSLALSLSLSLSLSLALLDFVSLCVLALVQVLLKLYAAEADVERAEDTLRTMRRTSLQPQLTLCDCRGRLMHRFLREGAKQLCKQVRDCCPRNFLCYTALLGAYAKRGRALFSCAVDSFPSFGGAL